MTPSRGIGSVVVSEMKDDDTVLFSMYMGEGKEPMFTILYKRKK